MLDYTDRCPDRLEPAFDLFFAKSTLLLPAYLCYTLYEPGQSPLYSSAAMPPLTLCDYLCLLVAIIEFREMFYRFMLAEIEPCL